MSEGGYKIRNKQAVHFVSFAVVEWVDVFTRKEYVNVVIDSLKHCQKAKGLKIHAWCVMSNHMHLVISANNNDLSDILRDFKKYTSKELVQMISENPVESRKKWMLNIFRSNGESNTRNKNFQFWQQDNQPKELYSSGFIDQKLAYIHDNPVEAGLVDEPCEYVYSSARDYENANRKGLIDIDFI